MERFPLLPKGNREDNHCIVHVLRESFQDVLHRQPFPENIAENAAKFHMDREILKDEAETVNAVPKKKNTPPLIKFINNTINSVDFR